MTDPVLPLTLQNTEGNEEMAVSPTPAPVSVPPVGGWKPTKKFIGAAVIGLITIAAHAVASGAFDNAEWAETFTLLTSLAGAYFVSNDPTPGGVPTTNTDAS